MAKLRRRWISRLLGVICQPSILQSIEQSSRSPVPIMDAARVAAGYGSAETKRQKTYGEIPKRGKACLLGVVRPQK